jgi:DNA-binding NtrC family response regulator
MVNPVRILVIEDNDFVRMQMVKFLADESYQVLESVNGEEALSKVDEQTNLVIADVRMEPMGGFEFVRHVRSLGYETPVILVTGDQSPDLLSEASKLNIGAVLMKPVQRDRLLMTVSRTLQQRSRAS